MEVILKEDVKNVGDKDEVVKVRDGFGRNYLIPRGLAVVATESAKKAAAEIQKQRSFKEEKLKKEAQESAAKIEKIVLSIGTKAGENGKIFGSVTPVQIADALKAKGFPIDRKQITLPDEHIKTIGTYSAQLTLHKEVKVKLNFEVVAE
jgi:large subunit ribosomal protein L9